MPMLDETEYEAVAGKRIRIAEVPLRDQFNASLEEYKRITGMEESNPNAVWHHRLSMYGPPCQNCGKPLRTPQAKLCGSCMPPAKFN
jgi:hypothetical protein